MQDIDTLFDNYIQQEFNGYFRTEGTSGVSNLEKLCEGIGYGEGQYMGRHYIMNFLADNPGAIELLFEFIQNGVVHSSEWQEELNLEQYADEEEEAEEDEDA